MWPADQSFNTLAGTPDSIVEIGQEVGCLEVKCPYACKTKPIAVAALQQSSFCLESNNGILQLKKKKSFILLPSSDATFCH